MRSRAGSSPSSPPASEAPSVHPASDIRALGGSSAGEAAYHVEGEEHVGTGVFHDLEASVRRLDSAGDRRGAAEARLRLAAALLASAPDERALTLLEDAGLVFEELGELGRAAEVELKLREASAYIEPSPRSFSAIYLPVPLSVTRSR